MVSTVEDWTRAEKICHFSGPFAEICETHLEECRSALRWCRLTP